MGNIYQYKYNWINPVTGILETSLSGSIYENILVHNAKKIGIKAPPGTQVYINEIPFVINKSGVLTVNKEGYIISSLYFKQPVIYTKLEDESNKDIIEGMQNIEIALSDLMNNLKYDIDVVKVSGADNMIQKINLENNEVWQDNYVMVNQPHLYFSVLKDFYNKFSEGYITYRKGLIGTYTEEESDLKNIIIDVEYTE